MTKDLEKKITTFVSEMTDAEAKALVYVLPKGATVPEVCITPMMDAFGLFIMMATIFDKSTREAAEHNDAEALMGAAAVYSNMAAECRKKAYEIKK